MLRVRGLETGSKPDWTIGDLTLAFNHMNASNTALLLLTLRLTRG